MNRVYVNNRNWVYCNGLREGNVADGSAATEFNYLFRRFRQHEVYTEKIQLLMVLGCTPDTGSLNTLVYLIID